MLGRRAVSRLALTGELIQNGTTVFPRHGVEDLISQLTGFGIKKKFQDEVERYRRFKRMVLGIDKLEQQISKETNDIDFRTYAKYLLQEGSVVEKRELLSQLKSYLKLKK